MTVDADTLVFLELLAGVELAAVLLLVGRLLRGEAGLWPWVLGVASATIGSLAAALGDVVPGAALLGALLMSLGPALVWAGARDHCGRSRPLLPIFASVAAVGGAQLAFPGARTEQLAVALSAAAWSVAIVWTLVRHAPAHERTGARLAAGLFLLHGVFQLARAFFPLPGEAGVLLGQRDWPRALVAMGSIFFSVAWAFAVLGLISQRLLGKMRDAARTDGLTGLLNRRAFLEDGARALEFCRRRRRPCAVVLADLDHFKRLNDTRGHAAGDAALRAFAAEFARAAGDGLVQGRYGGEEFATVIPWADEARAREWAEALRARVAATADFTASFGIAVGTGAEIDLVRLIARADEALYRAKAEGRDRVCVQQA